MSEGEVFVRILGCLHSNNARDERCFWTHRLILGMTGRKIATVPAQSFSWA